MPLNPKTVTIKNPDFEDGILINADDFDPDVHVLFGEIEAPKDEKPKEEE